MYLLIPNSMPDTVPRCLFTFHNVSINSPERINESFGGYGFTFHNVSINSIKND